MDPRNPVNYADLSDKTSMLRTDYALYLYDSLNPQEEQKLGHPMGSITPGTGSPDLTKSFTSKVGGIAGLGSSEARSVISLNTERYAPGDKIKINVDVDNTKCKKAVKNYKIKLKRNITCLSGQKGVGKPLLREEEWIVALKFDGCAEKTRDTKTIEF